MADNPADLLTAAIKRHQAARDAMTAEALRIAEERISARETEVERHVGANPEQ